MLFESEVGIFHAANAAWMSCVLGALCALCFRRMELNSLRLKNLTKAANVICIFLLNCPFNSIEMHSFCYGDKISCCLETFMEENFMLADT